MIVQLRLRRGTTAEWATANPLLAAGEPALDTDANVLKIGDGTLRWNDLPIYANDPTTFTAALAAAEAAQEGAETAQADAEAALAATQAVGSTNDTIIASRVGDSASATRTALSGVYARLANHPVSAADYGLATGASATANTTAITNALATGRPVFIPGKRDDVYQVNDLSSGFVSRSVLYGDATLQAAQAMTAIINKTGITQFRIDGLTFDGAGLDVVACIRLIDCTDFDLGTTRAKRGQYAGFDLQECVDFRATTLISDSNGKATGQVGSGVYLREKSGGTGCKRFDIGSVRGESNGLGVGLDGDTVHTSGSACTGTIGRIVARNNTRYGVKFQHTGGMVQVGSVYASGNVNGFSCPAANGLEVGLIWVEDNSGVGVWFDAACLNVHVGKLMSLRSGSYGVQMVAGAKHVTIDAAHIEQTGLSQTGSSGRGFDMRGVTRVKVSTLTVIDAGANSPNTTNEALYVDGANSVDVKFGSVTLLDTRTTTSRAAYPANFGSAAIPNVGVNQLIGTNFQNSDIQSFPGVLFGKVVVDSKYGSRRQSATILSGTANVTVTHGLLRTPTFITVTGTSTDTVSIIADTVGSTTFRIWVPSAVAADRTVYWEAGILQ